MVLRQGLALVGIGLLAGLAAAFAGRAFLPISLRRHAQ